MSMDPTETGAAVVEAAAEAVESAVETVVEVVPSAFTKYLLAFVLGGACGLVIGLAIAQITKDQVPDFVAPPTEERSITEDVVVDEDQDLGG